MNIFSTCLWKFYLTNQPQLKMFLVNLFVGEKNFFESTEYQYYFITSEKGEILFSDYVKESDRNLEKEIENQIKKILTTKTNKVWTKTIIY